MSVFDKIVGAVSCKGEQGGLAQLLAGHNNKSSLTRIIQSMTGREGSGGLSAIVQQLSKAGLGNRSPRRKNSPSNCKIVDRGWPQSTSLARTLSGALGQDKTAAFAQNLALRLIRRVQHWSKYCGKLSTSRAGKSRTALSQLLSSLRDLFGRPSAGSRRHSV